jgi:hypothetical protein
MASEPISQVAGRPVPGWRAQLRTLPWREMGLLAGILLVSLALRLATWNEVADGPRGAFAKTAVFGAFASALVWLLVTVQTPRGSWVPVLAAVAVLLCGDAVHYVRLANPITRGGPVQTFASDFVDEGSARRQWYAETAGEGKVRFERGAVLLESPVNSTAYIVAGLDGASDIGTRWWLPVAVGQREPAEEVTWTASIQRTGDYFVVTELRNLLVQAVSYGLHVTYPDERGTAKGHEVPHATVLDGRPHEWRLTRDEREIVLSIDGNRTWAAPQRGPLRQVKLGETKVDPLHSGTMRIERVGYASYVGRG